MEANNRLRSAVGFAMKAGKLQSGGFIVEKLLRAGKARLVILDETVSENTMEPLLRLCGNTHTPWIQMPEMGNCIGKPDRMTAVVTTQDFADMIIRAAADGTLASDKTTGV